MPKISQLPTATAVNATDKLVIVQGGVTKQAEASLVGGLGGTTPTGTGFRHVTVGAEDAAAKLVADADVDATAAIAGTKIAPDFGAQSIVTTGAVQAGTTPRAATGVVQLPNGTGLIKTRNAGNTADLVAFEIGPDNQWRAGNGGEPAGYVFHGGGNFGWSRGGAYGFYTDTSSFQFGTPRFGLSTPYASEGQAVVVLAGANYTLTAAEYSRAFIVFAGTTAVGIVATFPAVASNDGAYAKDINNGCADAITLSNGGATTASIASGGMGRFWFNTSGVFGPF